MQDVRRRLLAGEAVDDGRVLAEHPNLMPQLADELTALRAIRQVVATGRRLSSIDVPVEPLPDELLETPIDIGDFDDELPLDGEDAAPLGAPAGPSSDASPGPTAPVAALPADGDPLPGYRILRELPGGGQGCVYEAVQDSTGRRVAVKVLPGGSLVPSRQRQRFEREADALARLDHPNIVGIIDRGRSRAGSFYFAMSFVDGEPIDVVARRLRRERPTEAVDRIVELMAKVAAAVDAAHGAGIFHRDLKPANVLVDRHGEPRVLDFGLARMDDEPAAARVVTMTGQILGSLPWASPEQVGGRRDAVDHRTDVYSLGVMLYQLLAGRFPYDIDATVPQVIHAITHDEPAAMNRRAGDDDGDAVPDDPNVGETAAATGSRVDQPHVPSSLEAVVRRALAKAPHDRHPSAGVLADDLRRFLAGTLPDLGYATKVEPVAVAYRPRWWALTLGACLLLAAGVATLAWRTWDYAQGVPQFTLPAMTNSIGMRLVQVPAGKYRVGSPPTEPERHPSERQVAVTLDQPLWIGIHEVTRGQWRDVMGRMPTDVPERDLRLPVTNVTWHDAMAFCRRLSEIEGRTYRLPAEIEWEIAARAGTMSPFGGTGTIERMGWYGDNSAGVLREVGGLEPNHWGLHDMHGNAREWCYDAHVQRLQTRVLELQPEDPLANARGGCVRDIARDCRSAARDGRRADRPDAMTGFRVILTSGAN